MDTVDKLHSPFKPSLSAPCPYGCPILFLATEPYLRHVTEEHFHTNKPILRKATRNIKQEVKYIRKWKAAAYDHPPPRYNTWSYKLPKEDDARVMAAVEAISANIAQIGHMLAQADKSLRQYNDEVRHIDNSIRSDAWFAPQLVSDHVLALNGAEPSEMEAQSSILGTDSIHNITMTQQPKTHPVLTINTKWHIGGEKFIDIPTLLDTGCNTSLLHNELLKSVCNNDGTPVTITALEQPTTLVSASGNGMHAPRSALVEFGFVDTLVSHTVFVLDSWSMQHKIVLGRDFMIKRHSH